MVGDGFICWGMECGASWLMGFSLSLGERHVWIRFDHGVGRYGGDKVVLGSVSWGLDGVNFSLSLVWG